MKYLAAYLGLTALFLAACSSGSSTSEHGDSESVASSGCGIERWPVKVMTDPLAASVNLTPVAATVADLVAFPKAPKNATTRLAAEKQAYHVDVDLLEVKIESDSDIHMVLSDGRQTMIAEIPDPRCSAGSVVLPQITKARQELIALCGQPSSSGFTSCRKRIWITGVAFLDFAHGQTGVAKNAIELHPVLDLVETP